MKNDIIIIIGISGKTTNNGLQELCSIDRLNSGITNRHPFFMSAIFLLDQKIENDSVNHVSSRYQNSGLILGVWVWNFCSTFKIALAPMQMFSNACAKVKKWIFNIEFPGKWVRDRYHCKWFISSNSTFALFLYSKNHGSQPIHRSSKSDATPSFVYLISSLVTSFMNSLKFWD